MAPEAVGCCFSSVTRQLVPASKAVTSLAALTDFHLQVYPVAPLSRLTSRKTRKVRCSKMRSPKRNNVRLLVAVIGASGVVAIGALSVAIDQQQAGPAVW